MEGQIFLPLFLSFINYVQIIYYLFFKNKFVLFIFVYIFEVWKENKQQILTLKIKNHGKE